MPEFCANCGATLKGAFCNKCGARAVSPSAPPPFQPVVQPPPVQPPAQPSSQPATQTPFQPVAQAQYQSVMQSAAQSPAYAAPAAPAKGSALGKILLIVGGVLALLFVLGVAGAVYGVYWMKHKVASYASAIKGGSSQTIKVVGKGNNCRLLPVAEVQKVLGVEIEKSAEIEENSVPGCAYYTNQAAFKKLQQMAMEQTRRQVAEQNGKPGPKTDNPLELLKDANQMEGIVKTLGLSQPVEDGRVFSFTVEHNFGEDAWSGMRLTEAAVPGFEEVPGVGDHAMIGSFGHAFYLQKGDVMIHMNTTWVPEARARGSALGRTILGNL